MTESTMGSGGTTFSPGMVMGGAYQKAKDNSGWLLLFFIVIMHFLNVGINLSWTNLPFISKINISGFGWFNGHDISSMIRNTGLVSKLAIALFSNLTFWIIIIFVIVFGRKKSWEEFASNILMVISFCFVAIFSGISSFVDLVSGGRFYGTIIEIILIIMIRQMILKKKYDIVEANYYTILILFVDFYLINLTQFIFPAQVALINRFVFPILPLTVLFFMDDESNMKNILIFGTLIFYLVYFVSSSNAITANFNKGITGAEKDVGNQVGQTFKDKFMALWNQGKQNWNQSQQMISGDYYTGQVEQAQTEKLGVFLEDIKASDQNFVVNDSVEVWAKMKAYKLKDMVGTINISVLCYATKGQRIVNGIIDDSDTHIKQFSIDSYEEEFLTCKFPRNSLSNESGYYTVTFNATFNFNTQAYLRSYYMEKERKRTLVSQGVDILSQYGITDTNPVAKYTNGPVMIGMETTSSLPIGVPTDIPNPSVNPNYDFSSYIGITLDNSWKGTIKNITSLTITLPEGLAFAEGDCLFFDAITSGKREEYKLTDNQIKKDSKNGIKFPKSYKCSLLLYNPPTLLGTTPIAIKTFQLKASYIYQISESTGISIKTG